MLVYLLLALLLVWMAIEPEHPYDVEKWRTIDSLGAWWAVGR